MTRKKAMVQPAPMVPGSAARLAMALQIIGNDRAYTVVSIKGNTSTVHFEGDTEPKVIVFEGDKPEII
jgi:precorrin-6B methylase 1